MGNGRAVCGEKREVPIVRMWEAVSDGRLRPRITLSRMKGPDPPRLSVFALRATPRRVSHPSRRFDPPRPGGDRHSRLPLRKVPSWELILPHKSAGYY